MGGGVGGWCACGKWTAYIYKRVLPTTPARTNTALPCCSHIRSYWCSKRLTGAGPDQSTCKWEIQLHKADKLPHPFNKKASFCKCRDGIRLFPPLLAAWALHNRLTDMAGLPRQLRGSCTLLHFCAVQAFTRANQTPPLLYAWAAVFAQPLILGWHPRLGLPKIKARCATASAEVPGLCSWGHKKSHPLSSGKRKGLKHAFTNAFHICSLPGSSCTNQRWRERKREPWNTDIKHMLIFKQTSSPS